MNCEGGVEETITWFSNSLQTISAEICEGVSALKFTFHLYSPVFSGSFVRQSLIMPTQNLCQKHHCKGLICW